MEDVNKESGMRYNSFEMEKNGSVHTSYGSSICKQNQTHLHTVHKYIVTPVHLETKSNPPPHRSQVYRYGLSSSNKIKPTSTPFTSISLRHFIFKQNQTHLHTVHKYIVTAVFSAVVRASVAVDAPVAREGGRHTTEGDRARTDYTIGT